MKGVVFVELLAMAESAFGEAAVDAVLDSRPLSTGGAFTRVGNYPCSDLIAIVEGLSERADTPADELQRRFGHWMMAHFAAVYPQLMAAHDDALSMLEAIEGEVHVEVRKLYPEAELPRFETKRLGPRRLRMTYRSPRPLGAFCQGLIEACLDHFDTKGVVAPLGAPPDDPRALAFDVRAEP
jgi:hypothetical protein